MITLKPWAVYNEIEDYAADWLENLIALGAIAPGIVDRRSIVDVRPDDYRGFRQAHFFAGVSDDTALWTGSCPCQPFSAAGAGGGVDDERHLWPHWFHLIGAARPPRIYGEQVASKDGLGWLDLVSSDLEGAGYSIWTVDTCSAGSGAPHIRQRLRFCADDLGFAAIPLGHTPMRGEPGGLRERGSTQWGQGATGGHGSVGGLDDGLCEGLEGQRDGHRPSTGQRARSLRPVTTAGGIEWLADTYGGHPGAEWEQRGGEQRQQPQDGGRSDRTAPVRPGPTNGFWRDADWLFCRDGKWRPVSATSQSMVDGSAADLGLGRSFPLIDGKAFKEGSGHPVYEGKSRQGMLKGYGNAIDAEATIDFIEATLEPDTIEITVGADTDSGSFEDLLG